ncbi:MAG: SDR family oxidoreductase [Propionibacteriaceae bacterium]|jgi:NAD(P)-dependent dehydrogenase (short-subunit alcohol dehydrogenase family)|nr:SDR family oxidoreductase [Propionibacteriaceae bacterium]
MGRLDNKIAIVTGGNSGIGRATAELFAREGATVVIAARRAGENRATVAEITAQGGVISAVEADVTQPADCRRLVDGVVARHGRIDVLVNNAGIADKHRRITFCDEEWYDHVVRTDQYSVYYMMKYALAQMERAGSGSIINISSIGAGGVAGVAYSAAKAAVNAMTKNTALQYSATAIRINAVAPGPTPTPLNAPEAVATFDQEFAALTARHIDVGLPTADVCDQAEAILFFASEAAKAITGQILYVDHGTSLY